MSNESEIFENYRKYLIEEREEELSKNSELIGNFIAYCSEKGIQLTSDNIDYIRTIGIVAKYPNIVILLNSSIQLDKEGLIPVDILKSISSDTSISGFYYTDKYIMMAHPYFRRGHHANANFAPRFIDVFWSYSKPENKKYISIDTDRVRINVDRRIYMELDTWYGAKFQKNISDIEDGIVKLHPPLDLEPSNIDFFFGNTYSLDIKWSSKEEIKVFQSEDFKAESSKIIKNGKEYFPARYVHAEYDSSIGKFRHFDGAIHLYTEEEYYLRRDSDLNFNEKNKSQLKSLSHKMFKINGQIEIEDWIELTSHFLTGNQLIFEYFEGKLPDKTIETIEKLRIYLQRDKSNRN